MTKYIELNDGSLYFEQVAPGVYKGRNLMVSRGDGETFRVYDVKQEKLVKSGFRSLKTAIKFAGIENLNREIEEMERMGADALEKNDLMRAERIVDGIKEIRREIKKIQKMRIK